MVFGMTVAGSLCSTFLGVSLRTWDALRLGRVTGVTWSEPTITEVNLLDIQLRLADIVRVFKFSAWEESTKTGADWEWWIGQPGRWLGLRIQAKKIHRYGRRYPKLAYRSASGLQADLLIGDAIPTMTPLYCFYNYWDDSPPRMWWNCPHFQRDPRLLGCAIADAYAVRNLIHAGKNRVDDVLPLCLPWSCLACCSCDIAPGERVEDRVAGVLQALPGRENRPPPPIHTELPLYVQAALEGRLVEQEPPHVPLLLVLNAQGFEARRRG